MSTTPHQARPRPLEEPAGTGEARLDALQRLIAIVDRLRAPADGCPWDLEQTLLSLAPSVIEEGFELVEALERGEHAAACEEAGDLLMLLVLIARVAQDQGRFDLAQIGEGVCAKLIRRHPHVFGDAKVDSAAHVLANWEAIKEGERKLKQADRSALAGVPAALPALQRAQRTAAKAMAAGFRWRDGGGALEKLLEEQQELVAALVAGGYPAPGGADTRAPAPHTLPPAARAAVEHELGDLLLATAHLGTYLGIDPEQALRSAERRFERRFRSVEAQLGGSVRGQELESMLAAWRRAKQAEAAGQLLPGESA